jgi:hypothetical protein
MTQCNELWRLQVATDLEVIVQPTAKVPKRVFPRTPIMCNAATQYTVDFCEVRV